VEGRLLGIALSPALRTYIRPMIVGCVVLLAGFGTATWIDPKSGLGLLLLLAACSTWYLLAIVLIQPIPTSELRYIGRSLRNILAPLKADSWELS
jgi:hypothetical protein